MPVGPKALGREDTTLGWGAMAKRAGLALAALALLGAGRAFPSLSEQDPVVVVQSFQRGLARSEGLGPLASYLSEAKRNEVLREAGGSYEGPGAQRVLEGWRDHLLLMAPRLVQQQIDPERAVLVFQGQVELGGQGLMDATLGVLLVKEYGAWRIVRQKASYRRPPTPQPDGSGFDF